MRLYYLKIGFVQAFYNRMGELNSKCEIWPVLVGKIPGGGIKSTHFYGISTAAKQNPGRAKESDMDRVFEAQE